ncbi:DUF1127 domain-containing protein [Labrenzia suaedae]|uniref:DUF1127 domain-containing protein n=2 Tax=Roseibium litorale TaxID=2803841 RepID=A0ABR9CJ78_9HYPH|nr:DUF1127 domain-containing protein [Roseibium litorale]
MNIVSVEPRDRLEAGRSIVRLVLERIRIWRLVHRSRRQLEGMPDHALEDLGLTRSDVRKEAARAFWDHNHRS